MVWITNSYTIHQWGNQEILHIKVVKYQITMAKFHFWESLIEDWEEKLIVCLEIPLHSDLIYLELIIEEVASLKNLYIKVNVHINIDV